MRLQKHTQRVKNNHDGGADREKEVINQGSKVVIKQN